MGVIIDFLNDLASLGNSVLAWSIWMGVVSFAVPAMWLRCPAVRQEGKVVLASSVILLIMMLTWYAFTGYTRIIALPHILVWIPLLFYLYARRAILGTPWQVRWSTVTLVATIIASLVFDCIDVIRYIMGERGPIA